MSSLAEVNPIAGFHGTPIGVDKFLANRLRSFVWPSQQVACSIGPDNRQVLANSSGEKIADMGRGSFVMGNEFAQLPRSVRGCKSSDGGPSTTSRQALVPRQRLLDQSQQDLSRTSRCARRRRPQRNTADSAPKAEVRSPIGAWSRTRTTRAPTK